MQAIRSLTVCITHLWTVIYLQRGQPTLDGKRTDLICLCCTFHVAWFLVTRPKRTAMIFAVQLFEARDELSKWFYLTGFPFPVNERECVHDSNSIMQGYSLVSPLMQICTHLRGCGCVSHVFLNTCTHVLFPLNSQEETLPLARNNRFYKSEKEKFHLQTTIELQNKKSFFCKTTRTYRAFFKLFHINYS